MQLAQDLEGHHSVAFALTANNLGMIFRNRGDVEEAQPLLERAIEALESNPDEPDAGCAVP
jgi:Flp pilus assembly protein TadD